MLQKPRQGPAHAAELRELGEHQTDRLLHAAVGVDGLLDGRITAEVWRAALRDTKEARLIAMLHQDATISEMANELGWLRHTCHGALAG